MILTVKSNGMILKDSPEIKLNNFTVLTGENGSGKTQLLNWIMERFGPHYMNHEGNVVAGYVQKDSGAYYFNKIMTLPGITEPPENKLPPSSLSYNIKQRWEQLYIAVIACGLVENIDINNIEFEMNKINGAYHNFLSKSMNGENYQHLFRRIYQNEVEEVLKLSIKTNKLPGQSTYIDFLIFFEMSHSVFSPNINLLFHQFELKKRYYPKLIENLKEPIDVLNEVLKAANFKYYAKYTFTTDEDFLNNVTLLDNDDRPLSFDNLSSGEKTIMALIFTLYNSKLSGVFPELILFDEPDAFLHPSMTKLFLDVVQEIIVRENKVDVIMTTHSPSTIAMTPEESIYYMKRNVGYPEKISQGEAINSLIYGINGLFVSHENRRQVFVESENDVIFYEKIYTILKSKLNPKIQLSFISSGDSRTNSHGMPVSGCSQVIHITKTLNDSGNHLIWGIIDRDVDNIDEGHIKVFGNSLRYRYSIENYLFDPLLLGILLMMEGIKTSNDLGIVNKTLFDVKQFTEIDLQIIVDHVLIIIRPDEENIDVTQVQTVLVNDMKIDLPSWFIKYQGHDLEGLIIKKIPELQKLKKNQENALKLEIINKVITHLPEFVSIGFLETFKYIEGN